MWPCDGLVTRSGSTPPLVQWQLGEAPAPPHIENGWMDTVQAHQCLTLSIHSHHQGVSEECHVEAVPVLSVNNTAHIAGPWLKEHNRKFVNVKNTENEHNGDMS